MLLVNLRANDPHRFLQQLPGEIAFALLKSVSRHAVNVPYDVHSAHYPAKGGKSLFVGISGGTKVEGWLIANGDNEIGSRACAGLVAGKRQSAVAVFDAGHLSGFMGDRVEAGAVIDQPALNYVDLGRAIVIVICANDPVKAFTVKKAFLYIRLESHRRITALYRSSPQ